MIRKKIKEYLKENGIKQSFVARELSLSDSALSEMLGGKRKMTVEEYFSICKALNVDLDFFRNESANKAS